MPSTEPNLELMSLQFCSFLVKKRSCNKNYSYLDPIETLKSFESDSEEEEVNPGSQLKIAMDTVNRE